MGGGLFPRQMMHAIDAKHFLDVGGAAEQTAAIDADEQAAAIDDEINRLQFLLIAERAATVAATAPPTKPPPRSTTWKPRTSAYCFCWRQRKQP
jgi:hypothetical protein